MDWFRDALRRLDIAVDYAVDLSADPSVVGDAMAALRDTMHEQMVVKEGMSEENFFLAWCAAKCKLPANMVK